MSRDVAQIVCFVAEQIASQWWQVTQFGQCGSDAHRHAVRQSVQIDTHTHTAAMPRLSAHSAAGAWSMTCHGALAYVPPSVLIHNLQNTFLSG